MICKSINTATNTGMQKVIVNYNLLKQGRCLYSGSNSLFHQYARCVNITPHCHSMSRGNCWPWHREETPSGRSFSTLCTQLKNLKQITISSINLSSSRQQHSQPEKEPIQNATPVNYEALYVMQHIKLFRILGYSAKISTVITLFSCPLSLYLYLSGSIATAANIAAVFALINVFLLVPCMTFTSRVVCKIMISEDNKSLKISHMSVFGRRRDIYAQPQDLIVDLNPNKKFHQFLQRIKFQNPKKTLLFFPSAGDEYTDFQSLDALFSRDATLKKQ